MPSCSTPSDPRTAWRPPEDEPGGGRIVQLVRQVGDSDCGIASLAMLLGLTYLEAEALVLDVAPKAQRTGLLIWQLIAAARLAGVALERSATFDRDTETGIVSCRSLPDEKNGWWHFAVLHRGIVVDTDGRIADWRSYCELNRCRLVSIIKPVGPTDTSTDADRC